MEGREAATSCDTPGIIRTAVCAHHPSPAVMFEAGALDRELASPERSAQALFQGVSSFVEHYPSVLLHAPPAMLALGEACLQEASAALAPVLRTRFASLLLKLLSGVLAEVVREGADRTPSEVPQAMAGLLETLRRGQDVLPDRGALVAPSLALGKQVLLVAEDGQPPELWFALVRVLTELLLENTIRRVSGEPFYDGRWDGTAAGSELELGKLSLVRRERVKEDQAWLDTLGQDLRSGKRSAVDVFLEIFGYQRRDEREAAWESWLEAVAERAGSHGLSAETLTSLCRTLAEWIEQVEDRRFLAKLAVTLRRNAGRVLQAQQRPGLITALDTFGRATMRRLEREAGRGEVDAALEDLRTVTSMVVARMLAGAEAQTAADALSVGIRARTGPVTGHPLSREDLITRLQLLVARPEAAQTVPFSLLPALSLEEVLFRDDNRREGEETVGEALASLLRCRWSEELIHPVRAVLRLTPLSPFHLGSATTRAHLLALDPDGKPGSYLHDLREQVLSHPGAESLFAVEKVLRFWQSGSPEFLDGLATPESLAVLPAQEHLHGLDQICTLLRNLAQHAPVEGRAPNQVRWLATLPESYLQEDVLMKVVGFPGCRRAVVARLLHLLQVHRALLHRGQSQDEAVPGSAGSSERLLTRSQQLLDQRREALRGFFSAGCTEGVPPADCLDRFDDDLRLVQEEEAVFLELAGRELASLDRHRLQLATRVLGLMLQNAALSGLQVTGFEPLGLRLSREDLGDDELARALRRILWLAASARNQLAERLQPHLEDSCRRLLHNPLARPAAAYRELLAAHRAAGVEGLAVELGGVLIDDLLSVDGGLLALIDFAQRLVHLLERY